MNSPIKNIELLPALLFLTSKSFLDIFHRGECLSKQLIKRTLLQEIRKIRPDIPNHLIENLIESLLFDSNGQPIFLRAVEIVSKYFLKEENGRVVVKDGRFEEWQNLLTLTHGIPFVAYMLHNTPRKTAGCRSLRYSSVIEPDTEDSPLNPLLERLVETHMHINGTSETVYVWQHYLNTPKAIRAKILQSKDYAIELDQAGLESYGELYRILQKTKNVQNYLACGNMSTFDPSVWRIYLKKQIILHPPPFVRIPWQKYIRRGKSYHPMMQGAPGKSIGVPCYETMLWEKIFSEQPPPNNFFLLPHYYLLSFSLFHRLLTQQINQYGFDQFQIITDNKIRDSYEDLGFRDRFRQLQENGSLKHVELRFTPKKSRTKYFRFFSSIEKDRHIVNEENPKNFFNITTVAHFIKNDWCRESSFATLDSYRKKILKEAALLVGFFSYSKYRFLPKKRRFQYINLFTGIDAAGSELYARPEVFAPAFRYLRTAFRDIYDKSIGITFHAGEEFVHLISGIRYIYEAVEFLDLREGDRIGHATALGIDHKEWRQRYNDFLVMKAGEYLDNLIFVSKILNLDIFEEKIVSLWKDVYDRNYPGMDTAFEAYRLRRGDDYSPTLFCNPQKTKSKHEGDAYRFAELYLHCRTHRRYDKLIQVDLMEIDDIIISQLQNYVLNMLRYKKIAIESMITSNTRISIYRDYREHHIAKWLHNPFAPPILLASDDPGIFNTNLKNEYFHLYEILKKHHPAEKALEYINSIKRNGEAYRFD